MVEEATAPRRVRAPVPAAGVEPGTGDEPGGDGAAAVQCDEGEGQGDPGGDHEGGDEPEGFPRGRRVACEGGGAG